MILAFGCSRDQAHVYLGKAVPFPHSASSLGLILYSPTKNLVMHTSKYFGLTIVLDGSKSSGPLCSIQVYRIIPFSKASSTQLPDVLATATGFINLEGCLVKCTYCWTLSHTHTPYGWCCLLPQWNTMWSHSLSSLFFIPSLPWQYRS